MFLIFWKLVKTGQIATGLLLKVEGAMLPAFQKRIVRRQPTYLPDLEPVRLPLAGSQNLGATLRHLLSNRSKGFELAG